MGKRKLLQVLASILMVVQILIGPISAFAQEITLPASTTEALAPTTEASEDSEPQPLAEEEGSRLTATEEASNHEVRAYALLASPDYEMTTEVTINTNRILNNGRYGEGKFYFQPTFKFADSTVLQDGDVLTYKVPDTFRLESTNPQNITAADGTVIGSLTTDEASNLATITITNAAYFANLHEEKRLTASFTAVWADHVKINEPQTVVIPGGQTYTLTRIQVDDDPTGYTKWGVQDRANPELINWRIRVNRYARPGVTNVTIKDTIPEGQELVDSFRGYYFTNWEAANETTPRGRTSWGGTQVTVEDENNFTITPTNGGSLDGRGLYIIYQTRIIEPVDPVTKRALNNVSFKSDTDNYDFQGFAPLTVTDGLGIGLRPDEIEFEVSKRLDGRALQAQEFSFELVDPSNNVVATAKNDDKGVVKFNKIRFRTTGTFVYKIREVNGNQTGVTYDENEVTATVTVINPNGERRATVTYDKTEFTNSYKAVATQAQIAFTKVLNGRALAAGEFEFDLSPAGSTTPLQTKSNEANGSVTFDAISYDQVGTYDYTVTEKAGSLGGITYDSRSYPVTVTVTDNNGQLVANVAYPEGQTLTNTYMAQATSLQLEATKTLTGGNLVADQFTFEVVDRADNQVVATAKNQADGTIQFPALTYSTAGTHTYLIREKQEGQAGYTYDAKTVEVTVVVTDNGSGQLVASPSYATPASFENRYVPNATEARIQATKLLSGRNLEEAEFTFELTAEGTSQPLQTKTNAADGTVAFDAISYDQVGTYTYTLKEQVGSVVGVSYDTKVIKVTVEVKDNGGQLVATATYDQEPVFRNTYLPMKTSLVMSVKKELQGRALGAGEFEFQLQDVQGQVLATAVNDAQGAVTFAARDFTTVGENKFRVVEVNNGIQGVTYDTKVIDATVRVVDNQGQLEATASYSDNGSFMNTYKEPDPGQANFVITAKKELVGRDLKADEFTFALVDPVSGDVVASAQNQANGDISLEGVLTSEGQFQYLVREVAGHDTTIIYDQSEFPVTVRVSKNSEGQLVASVESEKPIHFKNALQPVPDQSTDPSHLPNTGEGSSRFITLLGSLLWMGAVSILVFKKKSHY